MNDYAIGLTALVPFVAAFVYCLHKQWVGFYPEWPMKKRVFWFARTVAAGLVAMAAVYVIIWLILAIAPEVM
jgi:hypothetical protein